MTLIAPQSTAQSSRSRVTDPIALGNVIATNPSTPEKFARLNFSTLTTYALSIETYYSIDSILKISAITFSISSAPHLIERLGGTK